MKILLFGTIAGKGGIQRIVYWLARILTELEYDVLILSTGLAENIGVNKFCQHSKAKLVFIESLPKNNSIYVFEKIEQFSKLIKLVQNFEPDVYLGVGTSWHLSLLALALPKNVRSVFYEVMSGTSSGWRDPRWGVRLWFDKVVGISPTVAKTFAQQFICKKPVLAIQGFPEPLEITASLPKPTSRTVEVGKARAAFFGRLVPHKQAFWLVQQWDLLKDVLAELHIHGTGPDEQLIRDYITSQGLGARVKYFGSYPSEGQAYADLINSYDLTLLPTIGDEGAPLVLLESMACGVPFVAYGVGGIPDYGVDNPNCLIVSRESNAFIPGVREMAHRLARGQVNQVQLQQFYLERYSYAVLKQAWLSYLLDK